MIVYKITNRLNGKVYIGKTTCTLKRRWQMHQTDARSQRYQTHFYKAIRKYGAQSFNLEILNVAKSQQELDAMERFFIILHQSFVPANGYNGTLGGDGAAKGNKCASGRRTIDQCRRMSEAATAGFAAGRVPWNKGLIGAVKASAETIELKREASRRAWATVPLAVRHAHGLKLTAARSKKRSEATHV